MRSAGRRAIDPKSRWEREFYRSPFFLLLKSFPPISLFPAKTKEQELCPRKANEAREKPRETHGALAAFLSFENRPHSYSQHGENAPWSAWSRSRSDVGEAIELWGKEILPALG